MFKVENGNNVREKNNNNEGNVILNWNSLVIVY